MLATLIIIRQIS